MNWTKIYKGQQLEFANLQKELHKIYPKDFPSFGTYPSNEETELGLTLRLTGAGNVIATDLATELWVKDSTWQGAVRGLRGNLGAATLIWNKEIFGKIA